MTVGGEGRTIVLEPTKSWGDFTTVHYGKMTLPSGTFKVTIRPAKIVNNLMSLRFVQFAPLK